MWETSYQILRSTVLWYSWNPLSWARTSFSTANKSSVPSLEIAFSILTEENYIWTGSSDVTTALFRTWHSQHPLLRPRPQTEGAPFPLTSRGEESLSETFNPNDTALYLLSFPFRERGGKKERKFKVLTCYYFLKSFPKHNLGFNRIDSLGSLSTQAGYLCKLLCFVIRVKHFG